jgi:hypothetical protein
MPGLLLPASVTASAVLPLSLCAAFTEVRAYPLLGQRYHDTTFERAVITDAIDSSGPVNAPRSLRSWSLSKRLDTADLSLLQSFWESTTVSGGLSPFYFYDPYAGSPIGSNWDPLGLSVLGRVTVVFTGSAWSHSLGIGRHVVPTLGLREVA